MRAAPCGCGGQCRRACGRSRALAHIMDEDNTGIGAYLLCAVCTPRRQARRGGCDRWWAPVWWKGASLRESAIRSHADALPTTPRTVGAPTVAVASDPHPSRACCGGSGANSHRRRRDEGPQHSSVRAGRVQRCRNTTPSGAPHMSGSAGAIVEGGARAMQRNTPTAAGPRNHVMPETNAMRVCCQCRALRALCGRASVPVGPSPVSW